jgi:uncharacterized protein
MSTRLEQTVKTESCLYEGVLRHRRVKPAQAFQHRVATAYIDLDELPRLLDGRLLRRWPGIVRFRRSDYHGDPSKPLGAAVRDTVAEQTGRRPEGAIRLLTNLRSFGQCFNPVSFYYCFDDSDNRVQAVLAEVTNTPWGERHSYVIADGVGHFEKALHVSPFMGMDHTYSCRAGTPGRHVSVSIESRRGGQKAFEASLAMDRLELSAPNVRSVTARYPFATIRVLVLIYGHAVGLKLAGAKVFAHPRRSAV